MPCNKTTSAFISVRYSTKYEIRRPDRTAIITKWVQLSRSTIKALYATNASYDCDHVLLLPQRSGQATAQ